MAVILYNGIRYDTKYGGGWKSGKDWVAQNKDSIAVQPSPTPTPSDSITLGALKATENKVYTAPSGSAWNQVAVAVPVPVLTATKFTQNGVYFGSYGEVEVAVQPPEAEHKEIVTLGTFNPPPGKVFSSVEVKGVKDATITKNGTLDGLYENARIAVPASREEVILPPVTANGHYEAGEGKMYLEFDVAVPEAKAIYKTKQEEIEWENVDLEVVS